MGSQTSEDRLRRQFRFLTKDFIETEDGLFFAVVASGVEENRVLAFLRYRRVEDTLTKLATHAANAWLRDHSPSFLFHSNRCDARLHGVPLDAIANHHIPRVGWESRQVDSPPLARLYDELQDAPDFAGHLGITGSFLVGTETESSDIDLVIYGIDRMAEMRRWIQHRRRSNPDSALSEHHWNAAFQRRGCDLTLQAYRWHEERKLNKFLFEGRRVDVSCIDHVPDIATAQGQKEDLVECVAQVTDASYSFGSPAVFLVEHPTVDCVVAHTPTYAGQAEAGEWIVARGWLEKTPTANRVVVGSSREAIGESIVVIPSNTASAGSDPQASLQTLDSDSSR